MLNCGNVTLDLKLFLEGFYICNGTMRAVVHPINHPTLCDSITVELHNATQPYALAKIISGAVNTNGSGLFIFPGDVISHCYYIVVRHRNSVETWSKNPVLFDASTISFYFTAS